MELIRLDDNDREQYNRWVATHPSGSFLQSWDWGQWQEQLGHKAFRFFIKDNERILLSAQVIQAFVTRLKKYYLSIPYGPLLGEPSSQEVVGLLLNELARQFPQSLFTRVEPKDILPVSGTPTTRIQPGKTLVVNLGQLPGDLLLAMHPKTRYNIKVAERHGVQIVSQPVVTPGYGLHLQEALDLIIATAKRQEYKSHSPGYYKKLIDFFAMQPEGACTIAIYKALYHQQLLATAIMVDFGQTRTYLFGGTSADHKNVMAPYALHWQAMQDAQAQGLLAYDFWGVETSSGKIPGFVRFKLGWGGTTVAYPSPFDIVHNRPWYTIYRLMRSLNKILR